MNRRVLFVDDDPRTLQTYQKLFEKKCQVELAASPDDALARIQAGPPYALIVTDMIMPEMSGTALLSKARAYAPQTVGIIVTGSLEQKTAAEAINEGRVYRFLTKPHSPSAISQAIEDALIHYDRAASERDIMEKTLAGSVKVLIDVLSLAEPQSFAIGQKLRDLAQAFTRATPIFDGWALEVAALLSQVGFVTIPTTILDKRARRLALTNEEAEMVLRVPQVGHDLISHIPRLEKAAQIVLYQHKNYDGSGFPLDEVSGEEIPYGARLFRILLELIESENRYITKAETVLRMRRKPQYFDLDLVDQVERNLAIQTTGTRLPFVERRGDAPGRRSGDGNAGGPSEFATNREIHLSELKIGDHLASDISTLDNLIVVAAGSQITALFLTRIANFGAIHRLQERVLIAA